MGYTLEEISPVSIKTWERFTHPEDLKRSNELLRSHFAGELEYYDCEARTALMRELTHRTKNSLMMVFSPIELKDNALGEQADLGASHSLGLQLVQAMVGQLSGEIKVEREPVTTFIISIPVAA